MMIWSFGHAWVYEALSPALMPFCFGLCLVYSITGGWNTDLADPGYRAFFQIFPFRWSINIMRYEFFGSCRKTVGQSVGILILYWIVFVGGYLYSSIKKELALLSDKTLVMTPYSEHKVVSVTTTKPIPGSRHSSEPNSVAITVQKYEPLLSVNEVDEEQIYDATLTVSADLKIADAYVFDGCVTASGSDSM